MSTLPMLQAYSSSNCGPDTDPVLYLLPKTFHFSFRLIPRNKEFERMLNVNQQFQQKLQMLDLIFWLKLVNPPKDANC